ncbi:DUF6694 family lipoprotein [Ningiella sp. W23]|uniref:DUF6694 family lipoprotein n=1 Tax=Ningiella sp. W23 TaxID=3023715 RepID=UPI003756AD1F
MRSIVLIALLFSLIACASNQIDFVFDGSNEATIKRDINNTLNTLPQQKRMEFLMALLAIQLSDIDSAQEMLSDPNMRTTNYAVLSKKLDGLTYSQILELASTSKTKVEMSSN